MTQPIAAPAWQPRAPKPPLTAREKAGARLAGSLGFLLLSLGWAIFFIPLAILAFGALLSLFFAGILRGFGDDGPIGALEGLNLSAWILPLAISSVVGILLIAASLLASRAILHAHGVSRPWLITLAGAGVSIAASWILSAFLAIPLQLAGSYTGTDSGMPLAIVIGTVSAVVSIAGTAAIGFMAWWWMAHLMRPATRTPE